MGDAVRRVQRHLQELSRDHLVSVEERHDANLAWLQIELQQLCKQIDVEVRVELLRPPRLSLSKRASLVIPDAPVTHVETLVDVQEQQAQEEDDAPAQMEEEPIVEAPEVEESVEVANSPVKIQQTTKHSTTRVVKKIVKRTRKVMRPKQVVRATKKKKSRFSIDVNVLKVAELKNELKKRGLKVTGNKPALAVRLREALDEEDAVMYAEKLGDEDDAEVEMEEVEEEYEEEIEEAVDADASNETQDTQDAMMDEPSDTQETFDDSEVPTQKTIVTRNKSSQDSDSRRSAATKSSRSEIDLTSPEDEKKKKHRGPKKSLSDLVSVEQADEIVRESAGSEFLSPVGSAKPAASKAQTTLDEPTKVHEEKATSKIVKEVSPVTSEIAVKEPGRTRAVGDLKKATPPEMPTTTRATTPDVEITVESRINSLTKTLTAAVSGKTSPVIPTDDLTTPQQQKATEERNIASAGALSSRTDRSTFSASSALSTLSRRYNGSTSFVDDSQPEQSPHRVSFAPDTIDTSSQATRAASTSGLEIQLSTSTAKTPDPVSSSASSSQREAHSEPRVSALKQVENELERKRREHQESIQKEAQRLRLAAKQSAKKRFEEARASSLFWAKREQLKLQLQSGSSAEKSSPRTPDDTVATSTWSVDETEPKQAEPEESKVEATVKTVSPREEQPKASAQSNQSSTMTRRRSSEAKPRTDEDHVGSSKQASSADIKRERSLKRRSSASDYETRNPPRKRVSLAKDKDPSSKRTSLTKETISSMNKRTSTGKERIALTKRGSLSSQSNPVAKARVPTDASVSRIGGSTSGTGRSSNKRRDSVSSNVSSSSSSSSTSEGRSKLQSANGGARKPTNLVSGLHSFTSLIDKDAGISSSQGSTTSTSSRQAPVVNALKMAEKSRMLEQKKNMEKMKRKEALMKKYEEQRKQDEEKKKRLALAKEKAEREARLKREQEKAAEKKQREQELAKKRQQRLQEMRAGLEKKRAQIAAEKVANTAKSQASASREAASAKAQVQASAATVSKAPTSSSQQVKATTLLETLNPPQPSKPTKNAKPSKPSSASSANSKSEMTTYQMSENEQSSDSDSDDSKDDNNGKNIPKWAQRENLERALRVQFGPNAIDPTPSIFPDFVDSCDLEAIFEPTDVRKKKRFQRRTSSGNWLADRPTAREKAMYKREMGFQR
ncbi:hypothetical protein Poli38472_011452 [Pythium oligandrum]|uniref:SAP domain-containing protein n=1 Tax=Pythium oligandrum TaxID=41045 RepID=A0A8K1CLM5_PYTOL|nr:hypothetical protein Poli38472_011452 [Pythium oligandrum]|eukprot:TMW64572.1 hypothetical protein Poli38472_011452 [Pythium oligandrum]